MFIKLNLLNVTKILSLISYHFCYSIISSHKLYFRRFYKMEFLRRYYFKGKFACFFLSRLLKILSPYFTSNENPPDMENAIENNGLNIKSKVFKLFNVLHNTQMSRSDLVAHL